MMMYSDPEGIVNNYSSLYRIVRLSISRQDKAATKADKFVFPGRYSNVSPYSSRSKSQHVYKTRSDGFKPLKVLFLWSVKTMMG
jgi:hypothetical protein